MLIQNLALYEDKYYIHVNDEGDSIYYFFDYDSRSADINMQFQHLHPFYEICMPLCPRTTIFIAGVPYELQTFDVVCIPPNLLHKSKYPPGESCKRLIIQFNIPKTIPGLSNEYEQLLNVYHRDVPIFRFDAQMQEKLCSKLNEIYLLAPKTDPLRDLIIHQKFIEFLTLIFLKQDENLFSNESQMTAIEEKIYSVASYIHAHYPEDISLDSLSKHFGISSSYLSHQFKTVTGFTVTDYIQMTRVRNVQALLVDTQMPITEVSAPCGFNSFSQFNRVFRKHTGTSPSIYRKQHRMQQLEFD